MKVRMKVDKVTETMELELISSLVGSAKVGSEPAGLTDQELAEKTAKQFRQLASTGSFVDQEGLVVVETTTHVFVGTPNEFLQARSLFLQAIRPTYRLVD